MKNKNTNEKSAADNDAVVVVKTTIKAGGIVWGD